MPQPQQKRSLSNACSRRTALQTCATGLLAAAGLSSARTAQSFDVTSSLKPRPWIGTRGIYGGFIKEIVERGESPIDYGINAVWVGSGSLNQAEIDRHHELGLKVYAEFNSMHVASYVQEHPDSAPIGADGQPSPPPQGWQGVSPFHAGYRKNRMDEFRRVLETFSIDGIWLDYHHAHSSWERDVPEMPDTDFCAAALKQFTEKTSIALPADVPAAAKLLLTEHRELWTQFRCDVFTDWVREYREILNAVKPQALLGTFHCPWSQTDFDGAIRHKLSIDLPAQAEYLDIFSIMPYHARFGHPQDPGWIARQTASLGELLNLKGVAGEKHRIWTIVQGSDWGEPVTAAQIPAVLEAATRAPSTGVMIFHWSNLREQWDKVDAIGGVYRAISPPAG